MGYNPESNQFEKLPAVEADIPESKRDWTRFQQGEVLEVRGISFMVHEIGETRLVLKPMRQPPR